MQRWLATAKAPCIRGGQLRPAYRGGSRPRAWSLTARNPQGRPAVGWRLQGATANGQPAEVTARGQGCLKQGQRRRS
ncbi:hypothetical protein B296_00027049 [Ensete ventricosum]|uniref:Uncharacterized protein n=1 Tax=Ensete ventricosum TaxID=4639 RepID=A0A426XCT8_ENSVE|nr:hypothetical protein B296_00027049 [Ensete ventricosum]